MRSNDFKNVRKKVHLSNEAKNRIKAACKTEELKKTRTWNFRGFARVAAVLACVIALSVSVYAAVELIGFYMEREADTAKIHAGLNETVDTSTSPMRAWNANEGEVMIKLVFGYMPEDIKPDLTANGKYRGEENNRSLTFSGYDLRICDLDAVIGDVAQAEEFTAGANRAFLLTSESEIALFNKMLYVLFEAEHMVIKASVGCGISEEELKSIAAELRIEETDDISLALPILNEVGLDESANVPDIPFIIYDTTKVYRDELLMVGESGHYEDDVSYADVTVEKVELLDGISSLLRESFTRLDIIDDMIDMEGNFISYQRTEVDSEAGKFGETVDMTKKLIVVTVTLHEVAKVDEAVLYPMAFLRTFHLTSLVEQEDGTIYGEYPHYVLNRTPGTNVGTMEPVYEEQIGENTYRLAYIIDEDKLCGELLLMSDHAEIYYVIPVDEMKK